MDGIVVLVEVQTFRIGDCSPRGRYCNQAGRINALPFCPPSFYPRSSQQPRFERVNTRFGDFILANPS